MRGRRTLPRGRWMLPFFCLWLAPLSRAQQAAPPPETTAHPATESSRPTGAEVQREKRLRQIQREIERIDLEMRKNERQARRHPEMLERLLRENEGLAARREKLLLERIELQAPAPAAEKPVRPPPLDVLRDIVLAERGSRRGGG